MPRLSRFAPLFAFLALLGALGTLTPQSADARRTLVTREVRWLNHTRTGGSDWIGRGGTDTMYTNVNGAVLAGLAIAAAETSAYFSIADWAPSPWQFAPGTALAPGAQSEGDTLVMGRFVIRTDSTHAQNLTAFGFAVDASVDDARAVDVQATAGTQLYTIAYASLTAAPSYSIPILMIKKNVGLDDTTQPDAVSKSALGHAALRVRLTSTLTGIFRKCRAYVQYWTDVP